METWVEKTRRLLADVEILPLEDLRTMPECGDFDGGIYFLWLKDKLQYIGKSRQICNRLVHIDYANEYGDTRKNKTKRIPYDRHTCIVVHSGRVIENISRLDMQLQRLERAYIAHYEPPFNDLGQNPGT